MLERVVDRSDRLFVVLRPPAVLPVAAAERPRAEPDAGDLQAGAAELCCLQCCLLHGCSSQGEVGCGCEDRWLGLAPSSAGAAARIPSVSSAANTSRLTRVDAVWVSAPRPMTGPARPM